MSRQMAEEHQSVKKKKKAMALEGAKIKRIKHCARGGMRATLLHAHHAASTAWRRAHRASRAPRTPGGSPRAGNTYTTAASVARCMKIGAARGIDRAASAPPHAPQGMPQT